MKDTTIPVMKFSVVILLLALLASPGFAQSGASEQKEKKLNVLFIAVDDLKPAIGAYGDKLVKTPNIDRLAARGIVFQRNYCQQAICAVSRTSLLSGLRPDRTGVWDLITDFRKIDSTIVPLPQYLVSKGYATQGFGKLFHEGSAAPGHDAKSWSVPYRVVTAPMYATTKEDPNAKRYYAPDTSVVSAKNLSAFLTATENADVHDTVYRDGKLALRAIDALQSLAKGNKPFFLGVGFIKPHLPFVAPKKYWDLYKREQFVPDPFQQKAANSPDVAYHLSLESKMYTDIPDFDSYSDIPGKHLSEAKQKELLHGKSLVPVIRNAKASVKEYAVSQYPRGNVIGYTIRNGRYRYTEWIENFKSYNTYDVAKVVARELYDYEKDPQEKISQAANPAYTPVVKELSGELVKHLAQQHEVSQKHPGVANHYYAKKK